MVARGGLRCPGVIALVVVGATVAAQQNDELGLDLRLSTSGSAGQKLIQTNHVLFYLSGGLSINREFVQEGEDGTNLELKLTGHYELFRYDSPKTNLNTNLDVFPNVTTLGRYRVEYDINLRKELITDFFWELNFYYSFDSDPPSVTGSTDDFGVVTSLGWSY